MSNKYIKFIPPTLQKDFIENRIIPFVGAGFSKNAIIANGKRTLDWDGLGKAMAKYMPDYDYTNALDALSLFETKFGRSKLIETMANELNVDSMRPGEAHYAFCSLNFEIICTTNFDSLIEQTLSASFIPFSTIVTEDRLSINTHERTKVIKIHGDFNNPNQMVITEGDYDLFVGKNKIMATYISNLFITKTLLLIGYSLDDYDIRSLWSVIGSRLGKLQNPPYVILVDASRMEVDRFERRNVKVINLPGEKENYGIILKDFFNEIKDFVNNQLSQEIELTNSAATSEFKMPVTDSKLCYISAPNNRISLIKDIIYGDIMKKGIIPITLNEIVSLSENLTRKVELLIKQSFMAIVDITGNNAYSIWEYELLVANKKHIILIKDELDKSPSPITINNRPIYYYSSTDENNEFSEKIKNAINNVLSPNVDKKEDTLEKLLRERNYNGIIISNITKLRRKIYEKSAKKNNLPFVFYPIHLNALMAYDKEGERYIAEAKESYMIYRKIISEKYVSTKAEAEKATSCISALIQAIEKGTIVIDEKK